VLGGPYMARGPDVAQVCSTFVLVYFIVIKLPLSLPKKNFSETKITSSAMEYKLQIIIQIIGHVYKKYVVVVICDIDYFVN
jgi:hypothetical protein